MRKASFALASSSSVFGVSSGARRDSFARSGSSSREMSSSEVCISLSSAEITVLGLISVMTRISVTNESAGVDAEKL